MMNALPHKRLRHSGHLQSYQYQAPVAPSPVHLQPSSPRIPILASQGLSRSQKSAMEEADAVDSNHAVGGTTPERKLKPRSRLRLTPSLRLPKIEDELLALPLPLVSPPSSSDMPPQLQTPRSQPRTQAVVEDSPRPTSLKEEEEPDDVFGSCSPPEMRGKTETRITAAPDASAVASQESYHVLSFKHVMREAIENHSHVLCSSNLDIARKFLDANILSAGAVYLFTRVYRRKHDQWLQEKSLVEKYAAEMPGGADVSRAAAELIRHDLFSSVGAAEHGSEQERARELLETLSLIEIKDIFKMVPGARARKSAPKKVILPIMRKLLSEPARSLQARSLAGRVKDDRNQIQSQLTLQRCAQVPVVSQVFSPGRSQVYSERTELKIQGTLTSIPPATRIAKNILSKVGNSVRIPNNVLLALERMHFVVLLEEQAHASPNLVLSFNGRLRFPSYTRVQKTRVFPSKEALNSFAKARDLERELDEAVGPKVKDWSKARDLGADAEAEVRNYLYPPVDSESAVPKSENSLDGAIRGIPEQRLEETRQQLQHPFFRRYTSHWVYVRAAWHSVVALESLGEYETAVNRLELLLETKLLPKRRGKILDRLTINLSNHLKKHEEAMNHVVNALNGKGEYLLHIGDRLELAKRAEHMHRDIHRSATEAAIPAKVPAEKNRKETGRELIAQSLPSPVRRTLDLLKREIPTQYFKRVPVPRRPEAPKKRSRAARDRLQTTLTKEEDRKEDGVNGKAGARVLYDSLGNSGVVHVEELALQWYRARGDWQGCHDEGGAFRFIFSLLLWECALFADVPDVFHSPFQNSPMDLHTEAFYLTRKEAIDAQIADIESMSVECIEEAVMSLYDKYDQTECVGCNWKAFRKEDLGCIAGGLGGESLARIIKLLATDYNYWAGGLCDLILWKREDAMPKVMLVEVKSARDKLSARQKAWFSELMDMGVLCEVFKVVEKVTSTNEVRLREAELRCVELSKLTSAE